MNTFWQHVQDPEYLHTLLNPLPVNGLAVAVLALVLALILRNQRVTIAALALVFICALSAWPTYHYGEAGYDRVKAVSDPAGEQWLDEHMARGEKMIWLFYVTAAVAAAGIIAVVKWPRTTFAVTVSTLVLGAVTLGTGGYIAYAGGHIRHKEFRFEEPPAPRFGEHHHEGEEHEHGTDQGTAPTTQKPMEHAGHEEQPQGSPQTQAGHAGHEGTQQQASPSAETPKSQEEKQLEASRLQLEASQKQLEASRKQLEATQGASASPSAPEHKDDEHPSPSPSASEHKHDDQPH